MKRKIILHIILLVLAASIANAEKYFVLDSNYIAGSVAFNSINLREIDRAIKYDDKSGFLVKTISFDSSEIKKMYYNMSENKNYLIYIPYDKNAARIEVYNPSNSKVMDIDVGSFADTCGNSICEPHESYESCQKDCKPGSKDDFCDGLKDEICDPDCTPKTDSDCAQSGTTNGKAQIPAAPSKISGQNPEIDTEEPSQSPNYLMWILVLLGVVVSALVFLLIEKIRQNRIVNSLKQYIGENIRKGFKLQQIRDALFRAGYKEKEIDKAVKSI